MDLPSFTATCPRKSYAKALGRSKSFEVIKIGTNEKLYDFLLVLHCIYMPTFYRFQDITIYWSKICVIRRFTNPSVSSNRSHRNGISLGSRV